MKDTVALINTLQIVASGLALVVGRIAIARRNIPVHKASMLTATAFAALFLVTYVVRWGVWGSTPFQGQGGVRTFYFALLIVHSIIAVVVIPFVWGALKHARAGDFTAHKRRARVAFPLWLFSAASGWVIWWMLVNIG